jgi:hypothetical protein
MNALVVQNMKVTIDKFREAFPEEAKIQMKGHIGEEVPTEVVVKVEVIINRKMKIKERDISSEVRILEKDTAVK